MHAEGAEENSAGIEGELLVSPIRVSGEERKVRLIRTHVIMTPDKHVHGK